MFNPFGGGGVSMSQVNAAIAAALAAYVPDPGYLEYVALLTQTGTNAPTANILANTLGETPTFSYQGVGSFRCLSALGQFVAAKMFYFHVLQVDAGLVVVSTSGLPSRFTIETFDNASNPANDILIAFPILIRVYP